MPRCLMAKKWKVAAYERVVEQQQLEQQKIQQQQQQIQQQQQQQNMQKPTISRVLFPSSQNSMDSQNLSGGEKLKNHNKTTSNNNNVGNEPNSANNSSNSNNPWGPSSPTEGQTAPSPPPSWLPAPTAGKVTVLFGGYLQESPCRNPCSSPSPGSNSPQNSDDVTNMDYHQSNNLTNQTHNIVSTTPVSRNRSRYHHQHQHLNGCIPPPKKRDLYRPYTLPELVPAVQQEKLRIQSVCSTLFERKPEDLTTAHAILDLSTSSPLLPPLPQQNNLQTHHQLKPSLSSSNDKSSSSSIDSSTYEPSTTTTITSITATSTTIQNTNPTILTTRSPLAPQEPSNSNNNNCNSSHHNTNLNQIITTTSSNSSKIGVKTVCYTYDSFFVSDGRSKKKNQQLTSPTTPISGSTSSACSPGGLSTTSSKENFTTQSECGEESDTESLSNSNTPSISGSISGLSPSSKARYTCSECGKHYATSSNLSRHKQTHRSLDSQSAKKCPTCGKAYVSMPALAMHILTHNLHHKCDVCGKAFSRPWLLQGHMRSHTGEKPYGCAHCGKAFADRSNLRAHMQTHSTAKNYTCKRCSKSFALKSYLNKHYDSACFKDGGGPVLSDDDEDEIDCEINEDDDSKSIDMGEVIVKMEVNGTSPILPGVN